MLEIPLNPFHFSYSYSGKNHKTKMETFKPPNQVLNLFLALLLSNFGSSSLSAPAADQDTNKIAEAFARIGRFSDWIKRSIGNFFKSIKNKLTNQISDQPPGEQAQHHNSWIWNKGFYPLVTSIYHFSIQVYPSQSALTHSLTHSLAACQLASQCQCQFLLSNFMLFLS